MRVIKYGKVDKYNVMCFHCKSIIEFISNEEMCNTTIGGYYDYEEHKYIICPVCKRKITTRAWINNECFDYRTLITE